MASPRSTSRDDDSVGKLTELLESSSIDGSGEDSPSPKNSSSRRTRQDLSDDDSSSPAERKPRRTGKPDQLRRQATRAGALAASHGHSNRLLTPSNPGTYQATELGGFYSRLFSEDDDNKPSSSSLNESFAHESDSSGSERKNETNNESKSTSTSSHMSMSMSTSDNKGKYFLAQSLISLI